MRAPIGFRIFPVSLDHKFTLFASVGGMFECTFVAVDFPLICVCWMYSSVCPMFHVYATIPQVNTLAWHSSGTPIHCHWDRLLLLYARRFSDRVGESTTERPNKSRFELCLAWKTDKNIHHIGVIFSAFAISRNFRNSEHVCLHICANAPEIVRTSEGKCVFLVFFECW